MGSMSSTERNTAWKALRVAVLTLLAWPWIGSLTAQEAANPIALGGDWNVAYVDQALGVVSGVATISPREDYASVTLVDPRSGQAFTLTTRSFSRQGDEVTLELEGTGPAVRPEDGLGYPGEAVLLSRQAEQLTVRGAGAEARVAVRAPPQTDVERVTLYLRLDAGGNLSGRWEYRVDPFLERDETGHGRKGLVVEGDDGVWRARGAETWSRPRPVIYGAVPVENQMALTRFSDATFAVDYPYPFRRLDRLEGSENRLLFVFGRDLPKQAGERIDLVGETPGINYVRRAVMSDLSRPGHPTLAFQVKDAKEKLKAILPEHARTQVADLDWVLIGARIGADAVPGYHSFTLNGQPVSWLLQFGDNTAEVRIVRWHRPPIDQRDALSIPWESTTHLFEGEHIWVEVQTAQALPVVQFPILLGRNGEVAQDQSGRHLLVRRTPDNPRLYRSGPISLDRALPGGTFRLATDGKSHRIGVAAGDLLFAIAGRPGLFSVEPQPAQAVVYRTPADAKVRGRWEDYMAAAATCHSIGAFSDTSAIGDLTNFTLNTGTSRFPIPGWFHTKAKLGHHAAMLALRDQFLEMMEGSRAFFAGLKGDTALQAFRDQIEARVRSGLSPFAQLEVTGPNGNMVGFLRTYDDWNLARAETHVPSAEARWALAATREALDSYQRKMAAVIAEARAIDACDVDGLLQLTGDGFEPVAAAARTKFMRRTTTEATQSGRGFWEPHHRARAWLGNVALLASELRIKEHLSKAALQETLMAIGAASTIVGVAALPVAIVPSLSSELSGIVTAVFVANSLWDIADVGAAAYGTLAEKIRNDRRYALALATAEVLGMNRVEAARRQQLSWVSALTQIGIDTAPSLVGVAADVPEAFQAFQSSRRLALASRELSLLEGYASGGGFTPPPRSSTETDLAATRTVIEPLPESLLQPEVRTGNAYRPIDEDLLATRPDPPASRAPDIEADTIIGGVRAASSASAQGDARFELGSKLLAEGKLTGSTITIRGEDGRAVTVQVGQFLGAGSFNAVYAIDEGKVLRIALTPSESAAARFDVAGQRIAQALKADLSDDLQILDAQIYLNVAADDPRVQGRNVTIIDRFEGPRASTMVKANLDGLFTPGQAIAFDKAMRAFNRRGYALLDAHPGNYAFRAIGDDEWLFVLLDPGGLVPVRGLDPRQARRVQELIDNPPQELLDAVGRDPASPTYYLVMAQRLIERYFDDLIDLRSIGLNDWSGIEFRPQGAQTFPKARSLASDPSLDAHEMERAYEALRREYGPAGTTRFTMPDFDALDDVAPPPVTDVRSLPRRDRDTLGSALIGAMKRAVTGAYGLQIQRAALERLERETGRVGEAAEKGLARLSPAARSMVEPLMHREDVRRLLATAAPELDRALRRDGERGAIARHLLVYEPAIQDIAAFLVRVDEAAAVSSIAPTYYRSTAKGEALDRELEARGWRSRVEEQSPFRVEASCVVRFFDPDGRAGAVSVAYDPAEKTVWIMPSSGKLAGAKRAAAEIIEGLVDPVSGGSVASTDFFTLQGLNALGVGYAGREGLPISGIRLAPSPDLDSAARLAWALSTYPPGGSLAAPAETVDFGAVLRHAPIVRRVERLLATMGYKVAAVVATPRAGAETVSLAALAEVHRDRAEEGLQLIERFDLVAHQAAPLLEGLLLKVVPAP